MHKPLFDSFLELQIRTQVHDFSKTVLNMDYVDLQKIVYPKPKYRSFLISKRNGNPRLIDEPLKDIKAIQRKILTFLEERTPKFRNCVHGFVRNRSIVTNAQEHCSRKTKHVFNIDLSDFFPTITFKRVRGALRKQPFYFSHSVASLIAHICTRDGVLPQGAPTSPFISNIICRGLDRDLTDLARNVRVTYTRYADDLTFSFEYPNKERLPFQICKLNGASIEPGENLIEIISKHGFAINANKTRLKDQFSRMEVTGITINRHPNVRKEFIDKIRGALHAWDTYGYDDAQAAWLARVKSTTGLPLNNRAWQRQTRTAIVPQLKNILWGRLLYLRMVRGKSDLVYTRLAEKYNFLCKVEENTGCFIAPKLPISPVVNDIQSAAESVFVVKWSAETTDGKNVGGDGTAFTYQDPNLIITCDHVLQGEYTYGNGQIFKADYVNDEFRSKSLTLISTITGNRYPCRVLHRSKQFDLAILALEEPAQSFNKCFFPRTSAMEIGESGKLIGFPAYQKGHKADFLEEKVLNIMEPNKGYKLFTITGAGSIRPGNSGGPFVDQFFKIAGVAIQGAYNGSGHDTCLQFSVLDEWIHNWKSSGSVPLQEKKPTNHEVSCVSNAEDYLNEEAKHSSIRSNTKYHSYLEKIYKPVVNLFLWIRKVL